MNRFRDYLCFAVQFAGLGYVVMWPLSTPGDGDLFGAALVCHGGAGVLAVVCRMPHPLQLGVGLHIAGALCAVLATLHLLVRGICSVRRQRPGAASDVPGEAVAAAVIAAPAPRARRRPMPPPRRLTEPRSHFGLRGVP